MSLSLSLSPSPSLPPSLRTLLLVAASRRALHEHGDWQMTSGWHAGEDFRDDRAIQVAAKVAVTGGPLYNTCGRSGCGRVEEVPSEFMLCSKCKQTRFCSKECFQMCWKTEHKHVCGTDAAEPQLPSQEALSALSRGLLTSMSHSLAP